MPFYTRAELEARPLFEARTTVAKYHRKTASTKHHIFLSHSHKDGDLVIRVAAVLGDYADAIFIDWKDETMPSVTSAATARRLKSKIAETEKFILLATNNALDSKWVPWELGVADKTNGMANVAVLPVTDPPHVWQGNEYIGIYSFIEKTDAQGGIRRNEPAVFDPETKKGVWLRDWLTRSSGE